jgi:hypothetical protein
MQKRPNWQSASENDWDAASRREKLIRIPQVWRPGRFDMAIR